MTPPRTAAPPFTLALVGGRVPTLVDQEPLVGGVGIVGETIEVVGGEAEVRARCRPSTAVLEVDGADVVPGFCDAHTHPFWQGLQRLALALTAATGVGVHIEWVAEAAASTPPGAWLLGFGWDESGWPERDLPAREALDAVAPDRAVYLSRVCGHLALVNTAALQAVTLAETSGIEQVGGYPTGRLSGATLAEFFTKIPFSDERRRQALEAFARACERHGVTSVHAFVETPEELEALAALADGPAVWAYVVHRPERPFAWPEARSRLPTDGTVRLVGVKLYADGSLGARTACLSRPYDDRPETAGRLGYATGDLAELMEGFHAAGAQVAVHAIGDAAVEQVITAAAAAIAEGPAPPLPPRVEHVEVIHPRSLHRLARMNLVASLQPNFIALWGQPGGLYERRLGARFRRMNPLRSFVRRGARLCFGSDGMPFGPLYGLAAAGLHPDEDQHLTPPEALRWYTVGGAEAVGAGDRGTIAPGRRADLAVLAPGSLEDPSRGKVVATVRGGRLVWQA
ncbi:MAG: amidohydrolase [Candidatus Tectimicrobiota bacterium]